MLPSLGWAGLGEQELCPGDLAAKKDLGLKQSCIGPKTALGIMLRDKFVQVTLASLFSVCLQGHDDVL